VCAACLKNSVRVCVEKIYRMGCLEGSGVPVLYIGCTVLKVNIPVACTCFDIYVTIREPSFVSG
jgi:hypothetical protein